MTLRAPVKTTALFLFAAILAWVSYSVMARKAHQIKWTLCFKENVKVCTDLIVSGNETTHDLAADLNNRGHAYVNSGDYDQAIKDFGAAIQLEPTDYRAYSNRGAAHYKNAEYDEALKDYDSALKLAPSDAATLNNRASLYAMKHEYIKAIQDFDKAINLQPDWPSLYCSRSALKRKIGNRIGGDEDAVKAKSLGETSECIVH